MTTLREVWEASGLSPTEVAAQAHISPSTLYKINRGGRVSRRSLANVLRVLSLDRETFDALEAERSENRG